MARRGDNRAISEWNFSIHDHARIPLSFFEFLAFLWKGEVRSPRRARTWNIRRLIEICSPATLYALLRGWTKIGPGIELVIIAFPREFSTRSRFPRYNQPENSSVTRADCIKISPLRPSLSLSLSFLFDTACEPLLSSVPRFDNGPRKHKIRRNAKG